MSKGSKRSSAPWVGAALLGAGVVAAGACGGVADNDLFDSGATSGATGTGGAATTSTSSTPSTTGTSTGQGGDSTSTGTGPGGSGGTSGSTTTTTTTTTTGGPICGNGIKEAGEACDGAQLGGHDCTEAGFSNPAGVTCVNCQVEISGCKATCDGQKLETGEVCDGPLLNGHSCLDLGYSKGDGIKCVECQLDGAGCKATCGNGAVEPTEACDDGNTTVGDGCDPTCHLEVTMGATCGSAIPVSVGLGGQNVMGTTVGGGAHTAAGCTSNASDRVYAVTATAAGFLTANLVRGQTSFDSVLYLTAACSDNAASQDVLCNDSYDPQNQATLNGGEVVSVRVQKNQTYFLIVDGRDAGDAGTYTLHLDLSLGTDCGDPVPIPLEAGTGMTVLGSTTGIGAFPTVQGSCGGSPGGQVIYAVTRAANGPIDADTVTGSTNYNSVLYARPTCNSGFNEIACSNNGGNALESITIGNASGGTPVFVYVDGSQTGGGNAAGAYGITFTP